jgi:hypothetical protein
MAQKIVTLCDAHLQREPEVQTPGQTFVVNINGRIRAMELCTICEEELLAPLQAMLQEHGRKVEATDMPAAPREGKLKPTRAGDMICPIDQQPYQGRAGLAIHARHMHQMSVEALLGEAPNLGMMTCPLPDCQHQSVSKNALNTHAQNKHRKSLGELETLYGSARSSLDGVDTTNQAETLGAGSLACPLCNNRLFRSRLGLSTHADKIHDMTVSMLLNDPDRVKCPQCPREYENERAMQDHQAHKHGADQFLCMDCSPPQAFVTAAGMNSHRRSKHKDRVAA